MTIESTLERIAAALETLVRVSDPRGTPDDSTTTPAPATGRKRRVSIESAPPAAAPAAPAPAPAAASVTPQPAAAPTISLKQWTDKFIELGELGDAGRKASIAIMESYGAARASLIPPDKYAEAYQRANAEIAKLRPAATSAHLSLV